MDDIHIVNLFYFRDERALVEAKLLYESYLTGIYYNILKNKEDIEEEVNDSYLKTWQSIPSNKPKNLASYMGKIVRRTSIDIYRKKNVYKRRASNYSYCFD